MRVFADSSQKVRMSSFQQFLELRPLCVADSRSPNFSHNVPALVQCFGSGATGLFVGDSKDSVCKAAASRCDKSEALPLL